MVATDWAPVVQTSIGAAAAVAGGLLTVWYQARTQERVDQQRRRERSAEVAVAAVQFLIDTDPDAMARFDNSEALLGATEELRAESQRLRTQLWILAAWHPSSQVRRLAKDVPNILTGRLRTSLNYARVRLQADATAQAAAVEKANVEGIKAEQAVAALLTAIEGS